MFKHITTHECFRDSVKELFYDASVFSMPAATEPSKYRSILYKHLTYIRSRGDFAALSPDARKYTEEILRQEKSYHTIMLKYNFVLEGFKFYREQFFQQCDIRLSGEYLSTIISGIRNLSKLERVTMCDVIVEQSPFRRSWPCDYLNPWPMSERDKDFVYQHDHHLLIRALSISNTKVKSLIEMQDYVRPVTLLSFSTKVFMTDCSPIVRHTMNVYHKLQVLHLVFECSEIDCSEKSYLEGLNSCLVQMPVLTDLSLNAVSDEVPPSVGDIVKQAAWPLLRHFSFSGMMAKKRDLVRLLKAHSLQSFSCGAVVLRGTEWSSTLNAIRACMPKPRKVFVSGPLARGRDYEYEDWYRLTGGNLKELDKQIEDFMDFKGVNPLLALGW